MARRGYQTLRLTLRNTDVAVYTSARVASALREIVDKATLYEGVRLTQVLEAVYLQGKKDGARDAFAQVDTQVSVAKREIPHKKPGRPGKGR